MGKKSQASPGAVSSDRAARAIKRRRDGGPGAGAWLAALGVGVAAWLLLRDGAPAEDDLALEAAGDEDEVDAVGDKLASVRERLFDVDGAWAFDRLSSANRSNTTRNFADAGYWDKRYKSTTQAKRYDWYGVWDGPSKVTMKPHVEAYMPSSNGRILNIGCGNSRFPEELHAGGYSDLVNIDISHAAVDHMSRELGARQGLSFLQMDATSMSFQDDSFAAVFEKGTLDALYTGGEVLVKRTVAEVFRVLRPGGVFVSVTFGRPSSRRELNATAGESDVEGPAWSTFRMVALDKETGKSLGIADAEEADVVYIYIMVKPGGTAPDATPGGA